MEGLTPEQAAQAAQWGPDVGPPGPVSWIMHIIQSQEAQDEQSAISGQASESVNPATGDSLVGNPFTSTPTFDSVSQSTTMSTSFETSVSTPSTTSQSFSSIPTTTWSSQDISTSDPATSTNDRPLFSLSIATSSTTSTSVSSSTTGVLSYEPISASFSFAPTSTPSSTFISRTSSSSSRTTPTNIGSQATETPSSDLISMPNSRKQAIVGGLAGAIGAMALIGILLCFCLRRRHRNTDDEEDEEDGLKPVKPAMTLATKPSTVRLWNTLGRTEAARSTPEITKPRTPSPVDGSLIRVSTEHWTRPFVRKEGMRESLEPAPLRVVNANSNSSRSSTPQEERPAGFVRKQRSALAAFLQDGARSESRNAVRRGPISYPKPQPMAGDPIYSSKAEVDSVAETQSFGSLPSDTSGPMVTNRPMEDPFVTSTTMLSTMEEVAPPMATEPTKTDLTRTVSHFGKNANPFRTQIIPSVALPPRVFSPTTGEFRASDVGGELRLPRASVTSNYSRRDTVQTVAARSSDQFDLIVSPDQMPPASGILAKAAEYEQREKEKREKKEREEREKTPSEASSPNWKVYEGT